MIKGLDKPVYVIEGFEMVGKSTFAKVFLPEYKLYHADHDLTDAVIGRHNSWTIGYGVMNFLSHTLNAYTDKFVIDRGVASSIVYPALFNQEQTLSPEVIRWYRTDPFYRDYVGHLLFYHKSKETAKVIWDRAKSRPASINELSRQYDSFSDFEDYWTKYQEAQSLFEGAYRALGVEPIKVEVEDGLFRIVEEFRLPENATIKVTE